MGDETYDDETTNVNDGTIRKKNGHPVRCYLCGGNHYQSYYPKSEENTGSTNVNNGSEKKGEDNPSKQDNSATNATDTSGQSTGQ